MTVAQSRLTERIDDDRAWPAGPSDRGEAWRQMIPQVCWDIAEPVLDAWRADKGAITTVILTAEQRRAGREALAPIRRELEQGFGFVVLDRIPVDRYTSEEATLLYWLIGQCLGQPMVQNIKGTLLYDVVDTGADYTQGARFSITNADSSFHTDGAYFSVLADYVALLCLRPAKSGGLNQMLSAYIIHNLLIDNEPDLLTTLYEAFHFDLRGEHGPGEPATTQHPVFHWDGRELTMRYLHYYIEEGHKLADKPLSGGQKRALAAIMRVASRPDLHAEFALKPGQMLFSNNHTTLHNRTGFEDHVDPAQRRHLVRLWLSRSAVNTRPESD